jgi:hypothetical protein
MAASGRPTTPLPAPWGAERPRRAIGECARVEPRSEPPHVLVVPRAVPRHLTGGEAPTSTVAPSASSRWKSRRLRLRSKPAYNIATGPSFLSRGRAEHRSAGGLLHGIPYHRAFEIDLRLQAFLQASGFRSDVTVFRLNARPPPKTSSKRAFRRNTAERVYLFEAAHNPEVAGSNPAPATAKGPGGRAFLLGAHSGLAHVQARMQAKNTRDAIARRRVRRPRDTRGR